MASTAGFAPAASTFARWRSDLTELRGQMASVAGLAPARFCLKGRARELLCIHGQKVAPEIGIAPTSPRLQRGANLSQLLGDRPASRSRQAKTGRPGR
jgi:hypothetical protein